MVRRPRVYQLGLDSIPQFLIECRFVAVENCGGYEFYPIDQTTSEPATVCWSKTQDFITHSTASSMGSIFLSVLPCLQVYRSNAGRPRWMPAHAVAYMSEKKP